MVVDGEGLDYLHLALVVWYYFGFLYRRFTGLSTLQFFTISEYVGSALSTMLRSDL